MIVNDKWSLKSLAHYKVTLNIDKKINCLDLQPSARKEPKGRTRYVNLLPTKAFGGCYR